MNMNLKQMIIEKFDYYIENGIEDTKFGKKLLSEGYDIDIVKNMTFTKGMKRRVENYNIYDDTIIHFKTNKPITFRQGEDIQFEVNLDTGKISLSALATNDMWVEIDKNDLEKISDIMEIIYAMYISSYFNANEKVENENEKLLSEFAKKSKGTDISAKIDKDKIIAERNGYAINFAKDNLKNKEISSYMIENLKEKTAGSEDIKQILSIVEDINRILSEINLTEK